MATRAEALLSGRYQLGEQVDGTGSADLYEGYDEVLERPVRVRLLPRVAQPRDAQRMAAEMRSLAQLNHQNVVRIFDAGTHEGAPYLVLQRVQGPALSDLIVQGPLTPHRVARIGAAVADGLAHAHTIGIVHRNVAPASILLDPEGRAYLADFGVTRATSRKELTDPEHSPGSPAYLAPEQLDDQEPTAAADVYALGLVLLECLLGAPAASREGRGPAGTAPGFVAVPDYLPAAWRDLLRSMTAVEPQERPSADAVATRFRTLTARPVPGSARAGAAAEGRSTRVVPADLIGRVRRLLGRRAVLAAIAAAVLLATAVPLVGILQAVPPSVALSPAAVPAPPSLDGALARLQAQLPGLEPGVRADLQSRLDAVNRAGGDPVLARAELELFRRSVVAYEEEGRVAQDRAAALSATVDQARSALPPVTPATAEADLADQVAFLTAAINAGDTTTTALRLASTRESANRYELAGALSPSAAADVNAALDRAEALLAAQSETGDTAAANTGDAAPDTGSDGAGQTATEDAGSETAPAPTEDAPSSAAEDVRSGASEATATATATDPATPPDADGSAGSSAGIRETVEPPPAAVPTTAATAADGARSGAPSAAPSRAEEPTAAASERGSGRGRGRSHDGSTPGAQIGLSGDEGEDEGDDDD